MSVDCPCRECVLRRSGWGWSLGGYGSPDVRVAIAVKTFVGEMPRWQPPTWLYTVEWLESELEEILGVRHAQFATSEMKRLKAVFV